MAECYYLLVQVESLEVQTRPQQTLSYLGKLQSCSLPAVTTGGNVLQYLAPQLQDHLVVRRGE